MPKKKKIEQQIEQPVEKIEKVESPQPVSHKMKFLDKNELDTFSKFQSQDMLMKKDKEILVLKIDGLKLQQQIKLLQNEIINNRIKELSKDNESLDKLVEELKKKRQEFREELIKKYNIQTKIFGFDPVSGEIVEDNQK